MTSFEHPYPIFPSIPMTEETIILLMIPSNTVEIPLYHFSSTYSLLHLLIAGFYGKKNIK